MARIPRRIPHRGGSADGSALPARYPEWFALGAVALPPGWVGLVEALFAELAQSLDAAQRAAFRVAAIRERDGRLVIATYETVPAAQPRIDEAVKAAARICQSCGAPGRRKAFAGWSATLCPDCRKRLGAIRIGG